MCVTVFWVRLRLKCDGTRAESRFRLSAKRTSPFKSAGRLFQSTDGSRGVRISGSNVRYTMFQGSAKSTGYPLNSPVSSSLPLPCVTVCHHISTGLYQQWGLEFYVWVSVHHKLIYIKRTNVMQLSSMFISNCNNALHVSDAFCVHPQRHLKL